MTEVIEEAESDSHRAEEVPPWLRASAADLTSLDFEVPVAGSCSADSHGLGDLYRIASQALAPSAGETDTPAARVWDMLWALTGLNFKPAEIYEPFGPMVVGSNGGRSAIPSDFREHVGMLVDMAESAVNPVLKARL